MVTQYGMSDDLGPIQYGRGNHQVFLGRDFGEERNYSEEIASKIDAEVRKIIDDCYGDARSILEANWAQGRAHGRVAARARDGRGRRGRWRSSTRSRSRGRPPEPKPPGARRSRLRTPTRAARVEKPKRLPPNDLAGAGLDGAIGVVVRAALVGAAALCVPCAGRGAAAPRPRSPRRRGTLPGGGTYDRASASAARRSRRSSSGIARRPSASKRRRCRRSRGSRAQRRRRLDSRSPDRRSAIRSADVGGRLTITAYPESDRDLGARSGRSRPPRRRAGDDASRSSRRSSPTTGFTSRAARHRAKRR